MFVDYRYPALIRGRIGSWKKDRHIVVAMNGRVEIEELGSDEAPLAATVTIEKKPVDFRWRNGKFYMAAVQPGEFETRSGLDDRIASKIADACRTASGADISPWPARTSDFVRQSDNRRDGFRALKGDLLSIADRERDGMIQLSSLVAYERHDREHWEKTAEEYMEGLVLIDGHLWRPVSEPMMAGRSDEKYPVKTMVDASLYHAKFDSPKDQPSPFGRRGGIASTFWDPELRIYPLNADDSILEGKIAPWMPPIKLHIEEAFGQTYALEEVDRVARVVVAELHSACRGDHGSFKAGPVKLREYVGEVRALLSSGTMSDEVGDGIVHSLQKIRYFLIGSGQEAFPISFEFWKGEGLKALINETAATWANREINLDVCLSTTHALGR
jgi:hypothetical protein